MRWEIAKEARSAELGIIISYLITNASGIILFKAPTKYGEFFPTVFVKITGFQLVQFIPYLESMGMAHVP